MNGVRARPWRGEGKRGRKRDDRRDHVEEEGDRHRYAVSETVDDQAEQDDRDCEREETRTQQVTNLLLSEVEFRAPLTKDRSANGKSE